MGLSHDWWTQEVPPQEVQPSRTFWGGTSWYLPYILTDYNYQTLESSPVDEVTSAYRQIVTSVIFVMKSQQVWEEGMYGIPGWTFVISKSKSEKVRSESAFYKHLLNTHGGKDDEKEFSDYFEIQILKSYKNLLQGL